MRCTGMGRRMSRWEDKLGVSGSAICRGGNAGHPVALDRETSLHFTVGLPGGLSARWGLPELPPCRTIRAGLPTSAGQLPTKERGTLWLDPLGSPAWDNLARKAILNLRERTQWTTLTAIATVSTWKCGMNFRPSAPPSAARRTSRKPSRWRPKPCAASGGIARAWPRVCAPWDTSSVHFQTGPVALSTCPPSLLRPIQSAAIVLS